MTINVVCITVDGEFVDLAIFDGLRLIPFDLVDGKKVVILMGFFVDSDLQYPVAFCKSFDDGKNILTSIQKAMMVHQRIVDIRPCTFQPSEDILESLQAVSQQSPIDREKRTKPQPSQPVVSRVREVVAEEAKP